jgi:hypothetical protein
MYSADDAWGALTSDIVAHAQINWTVFAQYTGRHGTYSLELCNQVPLLSASGDPDPCVHFFTEGQSEPVTIPSRFLPSFDQRDASLQVRQSLALWCWNIENLSLSRYKAPSLCRIRQVSVLASSISYSLSPAHSPPLYGSSAIALPHRIFVSVPSQGLMGHLMSSSHQPSTTCP